MLLSVVVKISCDKIAQKVVATAGWFGHRSGDRNCQAFSGRVSVRTGLRSPHVLQSFLSFPSSFCSCFPAPLRASPDLGDLLVPAPDHQASNPGHSRVTLHSTTELREDTRQSGELFRVTSIYSLIIMSESISIVKLQECGTGFLLAVL